MAALDLRGIIGAAALAMILALCCAQPSAAGESAPKRGCVMAEEASVHGAGDSGEEDEDAPPRFTRGFYKLTLSLEVSLDGIEGRELPVSIEGICGVPRAYAKQAMQLAGADGVAIVYRSTTVFEGRTRLLGEKAIDVIGGADSADMRARLASSRNWREDEDGNKVATFKAQRVDVTD